MTDDIISEPITPSVVFDDMTARKAYLEDFIGGQQAVAKTAYLQIAAARDELKTVKRLLSAAKPRTRTKRAKT